MQKNEQDPELGSLGQTQTKVSVKFYFNTLSRKRKFTQDRLTMSLLHEEVKKL